MRKVLPCLLALCACLLASDALKLFTFGNQGPRRSGEALADVALTPGRPGVLMCIAHQNAPAKRPLDVPP